jgi:hypothetical protein
VCFVNCAFINNTASVAGAANRGSVGVLGGGAYLDGNGSFEGCVLQRNNISGSVWGNISLGYAYGGGIYWTGQGRMANSTITDNVCNSAVLYANGTYHCSCASLGSGAYLNGTVQLRNCMVARNQVLSENPQAGGVFQNSGSATIVNCTITHNNNERMRLSSGAATVINCTIAYNDKEALRMDDGSSTILNSILFFNNGGGSQIFNTPSVNYSDVQGGYAGTNNHFQSSLCGHEWLHVGSWLALH